MSGGEPIVAVLLDGLAHGVQEKLRALAPANDAQRLLQARALQISGELAHTRWLLRVQVENPIPKPFLLMLIFSLTIIFIQLRPFCTAQRYGDHGPVLLLALGGPLAESYVAVQHHAWWFYIADDDQRSKASFSLLNILFSLQSASGKGKSPLLTLPVGK